MISSADEVANFRFPPIADILPSFHNFVMPLRLSALLAALVSGPMAAASAAGPPEPANPLTARIHAEDADRFAELFAKTNGAPTAAQIQTEYLDKGSYGVEVFTPNRIRDAENLAGTIAARPAMYRKAIEVCLPAAKAAEADLRSIYLGMAGLLPDAKLPQIFLVFGAGTSGGTAGPGAQVLGLEVLCAITEDKDSFRSLLRHFFAHETVHTLQQQPDEVAARRSPLLASSLAEGAADFISSLVTGEIPDAKRAAWAQEREAELWREFQKDIALTRNIDLDDAPKDSPARRAMGRWIGNYMNAPEGWPHEVGYWVGMRIWQSYFAAAEDKQQAIRDVLNWTDPEEILSASGYAGGAAQ